MSYKIDSYTLKQYVTNNWIKTPRFQRAKTWKASQKFDLVLSIFKRYPLGCVILCKERNLTPLPWPPDTCKSAACTPRTGPDARTVPYNR